MKHIFISRRGVTFRGGLIILLMSTVGVLPITPAYALVTKTVCDSACDYSSIQAAVNDSTADVITISAGTYAEAVKITRSVTLVGAGDSDSGTIIDPLSGNALWLDAASNVTVSIAGIRAQGAGPSGGNGGSGIYVTGSASQIDLTLDGITSLNNVGHGLVFNNSGSLNAFIKDSHVTYNNEVGIKVATNLPSIHLTLEDSVISENGKIGLDFNSGESDKHSFSNSITLNRVSFTNNARITPMTDISLLSFNGDLSVTDVTLVSNHPTGGSGFVICGYGGTDSAAWYPAGSITISGLTISGSTYKSAFRMEKFSAISNVSISGVDARNAVVTDQATWSQFDLLTNGQSLTLADSKLKSMQVKNSSGINAFTTSFYSADGTTTLDKTNELDGFAIEDAVRHAMDASGRGLVRWRENHLYATPNSGSLNRAYALATVVDQLHIQPGTYSEATVLESGSLDVSGTLVLDEDVDLRADVQVAGSLQGSGTIDGNLDIQNTGALAPGNSPGRITVSHDYSQAGNLAIEVKGDVLPLAPGSSYDQVEVGGRVALGPTSTLTVTFSGSAITSAATVVIIRNNSSSAVSGTFSGMPEGWIIESGGQKFRLSYIGDDGNDVTLSVLTQDTLDIVAAAVQKYGTTQTLSTSGGSGSGAVTYQVTGPCSLSGNVLTMNSGSGSCEVVATKAAADGYLEATATKSVTATPRQITITAADKATVYGQAAPSATYSESGDGFVVGETYSVAPSCAASYSAGDPVGTYAIRCSATADTSKYAINFVSGRLTVTPLVLQEGRVYYSGLHAFESKSVTDTSVLVPLQATIDISDSQGSIHVEDAYVTFVDKDSGKVLAKNVNVASAAMGFGIATAWVTLQVGPDNVSDYRVKVVLSGSFTGDNTQETAVVTVMLPSASGTVLGGGLLIPRTSLSAGKYVDESFEGVLTSFYFTGYGNAKKSASPKGRLVGTWAGANGLTYLIKSNAIASLSGLTDTSAVVLFKASLSLIDEAGVEVGLDGNVIGRLEVKEGGDFGEVGLTLQSSKNSALYLSTNWVKPAGSKSYSTVPVPVTGEIAVTVS